tara:strand:- start:7 stop:126 length:120 start_codon:yes stop_codon:yes gene_type:complete
MSGGKMKLSEILSEKLKHRGFISPLHFMVMRMKKMEKEE